MENFHEKLNNPESNPDQGEKSMALEEMQEIAGMYKAKWENFLKKLREEAGENSLQVVYMDADSPYIQMENFIDRISEKYGEDVTDKKYLGKCLMKHALTGSGIDGKGGKAFNDEDFFLDYDGEFSIINFMEELIKKYDKVIK